MRKTWGLAALFLSACIVPAFGQVATCSTATPALCTVGNAGAQVQIKPQAAPTSTTIVTSQDAYLKQVTVTNTTGSAVTFTLADRQSSPIAIVSALSVAANTTYVISFPVPYWCPLGFTVVAGATGMNYSGTFLQ